jgi:very-short-patch-repair endonuclease
MVDWAAMDADRIPHAIAALQHGLLTRGQLTEAGLTARMIEARIRRGRLALIHRGVYRIPGSVASYEQRVLGAALALGGTSAASHRTAAVLWDLDLSNDDVVELSTVRPRSDRLHGAIVHRSVDLTPDQVVRRRRIPTTTPLRLLVDLGAVLPASQVSNALDELVGRRVVTLAGVRSTLDRLAARGRSGCGVLREILEQRTGRERAIGGTRLEGLLADACAAAGIDLEFQYAVVLAGRRRRIDFAIPALRIAIEVDGYESHSRYDVFEDDRVRGNDLQLAGWSVLRFTWRQLVDRPGYVIATIAAAVDAASALAS